MEQFDVFLCHNSEDKAEVIKIAYKLKNEHKIKPWLDDWELPPGYLWQPELERQIQNIKSAAVFIGKTGIGPWQEEEIDSFLREFKRRKCPVIPVLLSNAPQQPQLPLFLAGRTWVDFRTQNRVYTDPYIKLVWGITGQHPGRTSIIPPKLTQPSPDRRQFLRWLILGGVVGGVLTTWVVGREIYLKNKIPVVDDDLMNVPLELELPLPYANPSP